MADLRPLTDGIVGLRAPTPADTAPLIAGRDEVSRRWLGAGSNDPRPTACIEVAGELVGWVDFDSAREWLAPGEVNVGYQVFPAHRGRGYATRAVQLLMHHFALLPAGPRDPTSTRVHTATLLINRDNHASLRLAGRAGFAPAGDIGESHYFKRAVPPLAYSDGVVTIRRLRVEDIEADLEAKDDEQIDWLWLPGQRQSWEAMSAAEQRAHALRGLADRRDAFGAGPKWAFAVDGPAADYVAYVDADLANDDVPAGTANISYSAHPAHRRKGYVSRAVRLLAQFLSDHTGARDAHICVDAENAASLRVAHAVGAVERERWIDERGRTMVRHVLPVPVPLG